MRRRDAAPEGEAVPLTRRTVNAVWHMLRPYTAPVCLLAPGRAAAPPRRRVPPAGGEHEPEGKHEVRPYSAPPAFWFVC